MKNANKVAAIIATAFTAVFLLTGVAGAHCDTLDGPVVAAARAALATGEVTPVLKWVSVDDEEAIRAAFTRTLAVRTLSEEARKLADIYFFETLVRIHRAGEGAAYTGLKPGSNVDPAVEMADQSLESGSVEKISKALSGSVDKGLRQRFLRVMKAKEHAEESVAAGRRFVEAYVQYTHYAESIHHLVKGAATH